MATFREEQTRPRGGWSRTRWLVLAAIAIAVVLAVVLLIVYSGGGGSGGGGGY
jgi:anti-sigma-K factor RskA